MKPQQFWNIENIKNEIPEDELIERWRYLTIQLKSYFDILNKGIKIQDNLSARVIEAVFTAADTDITFSHGLGFTPLGYIPIGSSVAMSIYDGDMAWNNSNIVLKSNAVGTARILVF